MRRGLFLLALSPSLLLITSCKHQEPQVRKKVTVPVDTAHGMQNSANPGDTVVWTLQGSDKPPFYICFKSRQACDEGKVIDGSSGTATCTVSQSDHGTYKYDVGNKSDCSDATAPPNTPQQGDIPFRVTPCSGCGELDTPE